jgi:hypothetical protein
MKGRGFGRFAWFYGVPVPAEAAAELLGRAKLKTGCRFSFIKSLR